MCGIWQGIVVELAMFWSVMPSFIYPGSVCDIQAVCVISMECRRVRAGEMVCGGVRAFCIRVRVYVREVYGICMGVSG